jgi:hypothetical protein
MLIKWHERLSESPSLRDINNWPNIDIDRLPKSKRKIFLRNKAIVCQILKGERSKDVSTNFRVSKGTVSTILKRCLGGDADSSPALTKALTPHRNIIKRARRKAFPTLNENAGCTGCFAKLMTLNPRIGENLDRLLTGDIKNDPQGQNVSVQIAFDEYKRTLAECNWPTDVYPYTTESLGYYSLRSYVKLRIKELNDKKYNHVKKRVVSAFSQTSKALLDVEIDEQIVDLNCAITLSLNDTLIPLRLSRVSLLLAIDVATDCILGYHIAYTKSPNQQDMLSLLISSLYSSTPRTLSTPFLEPPPGKLFPSHYLGVYKRMTIGTLHLDNALIHKANSVKNYICDYLGGTINLGIPANPNDRNWIEYAFNRVNKLSHRFKSTTGSHVRDPIKETRKNKKNAPAVNLEAFEEALYISLGKHNITPQKRLGNHSPLSTFLNQIDNHYVRLHPIDHDKQKSPHHDRKYCSIRHSKTENRAPHINFYGVKYTGTCLNTALDKNVDVYFERIDIRVLKIYDKDGVFLGDVCAPKTWMQFRHSIHTRNILLKFNRKNRFHDSDPFSHYFAHLLGEKDMPKTALEIYRVFSEVALPNKSYNSEHGASTEIIQDNNRGITDDNETICTFSSSTNKKVSQWNTDWATNSRDRV